MWFPAVRRVFIRCRQAPTVGRNEAARCRALLRRWQNSGPQIFRKPNTMNNTIHPTLGRFRSRLVGISKATSARGILAAVRNADLTFRPHPHVPTARSVKA